MSLTFTKLFSSITESTVWCEPAHTRLVWITMLAMADRKGRVWASIPGLANRARVPLEDAEKAIETFLGPDKYSRTPDFEGRRIEPIDGGWQLLNHAKYRDMRDDVVRREYMRDYMKERRKQEKLTVNPVSRQLAKAEADTEADTDKKSKALVGATAPDPSPVIETLPLINGQFEVRQSFLAELEPIYPKVDVPATVREMKGWLIGNPDRRKTRKGVKRFITQWLQKEQQKAEAM